MAKGKKDAKQPVGYRIYAQYVLVGAAIGGYYGIFYRGTQAVPDFGMAVILAVVAGVLTTVVRNWKKKKTFKEIAFDFIKITAMFAAFLFALQLKPILDQWGGRVLVAIAMISLGALLGLILGITRKPVQK